MNPDTVYPASFLERCLVLLPASPSDSNLSDMRAGFDRAKVSLIYDEYAG